MTSFSSPREGKSASQMIRACDLGPVWDFGRLGRMTAFSMAAAIRERLEASSCGVLGGGRAGISVQFVPVARLRESRSR